MDLTLSSFAEYVKAAHPSQISQDPTLEGRLVIARDGKITVTYAPFEYVNEQARIVLVGITPGRQQAVNALLEAHRRLKAGVDPSTASKAAKEIGSFSGPLRRSLVELLDYIGLHGRFGIRSCSELFGSGADLVHYTSALRYPVYFCDQNYSGGGVNMLSHKLLRSFVVDCLGAEARQLRNAVWIPLGPKPAAALKLLVQSGLLDPTKVLDGLPHPSGANAERIAYFLGRKPVTTLSSKTNAKLLDAARSRLTSLVAGLPMNAL